MQMCHLFTTSQAFWLLWVVSNSFNFFFFFFNKVFYEGPDPGCVWCTNTQNIFLLIYLKTKAAQQQKVLMYILIIQLFCNLGAKTVVRKHKNSGKKVVKYDCQWLNGAQNGYHILTYLLILIYRKLKLWWLIQPLAVLLYAWILEGTFNFIISTTKSSPNSNIILKISSIFLWLQSEGYILFSGLLLQHFWPLVVTTKVGMTCIFALW